MLLLGVNEARRVNDVGQREYVVGDQSSLVCPRLLVLALKSM